VYKDGVEEVLDEVCADVSVAISLVEVALQLLRLFLVLAALAGLDLLLDAGDAPVQGGGDLDQTGLDGQLDGGGRMPKGAECG
jgi:hypothetical protein